MSTENPSIPKPVCEKCWLRDHTHWEPESVDDMGNILMRLKGVDVPIKYNTGQVETCSECGEITIAGIIENEERSERTFKKQFGAKKGFGLVEEDKPEDYE